MIKICFFGTGFYAAKILESLYQDRFQILKVISQTDKKQGRGLNLLAPPVVRSAKKLALKVLQPMDLTDNIFFRELKETNADFFVVVDYGKILKNNILEIPKIAAINIHFSLLPKWRGASPVRDCLKNGDEYSGISIFKLNQKLDAGDIILQKKIKITKDFNYTKLMERLTLISCYELKSLLHNFAKITPVKQVESEASYSSKISKKHCLIDWSQSSQKIYWLYQAMSADLKIFSYCKNKKVFLIEIELADNSTSYQDYGKILEKKKETVEVTAGKGSLVLRKIQLENKKPIAVKDWINGYNVKEGDYFTNLIN